MHLVSKNYIKIFIVALLALALLLAIPAPVFAQATNDACEAIGGSTAGGGCTVAGDGNLNNTVATIVNVLSVVVGIVAVIMIIIGGFKYVVSGGDSAGVQSAKNTILYAIVGLVVVALAQVIVQFTLDTV